MEPIEPPSGPALAAEAIAHYQAGRLEQAATVFARIVERDPANVGATLMLGLILSESGDPAAAEAWFTRCLELSPGNFLALNHLGQLRQAGGHDVSAIDLFERAVAANPTFAPAFNNLGVSLQRLGRRPAALAALDRALELDPSMIALHGNRGHVLADLGRWELAAQAFSRAVELTPEAAPLWRSLGTAYRHGNRIAEAEQAGRRAVALDPSDLESLVQLAATLERAGQAEEAAALFADMARRRGVVIEPCQGATPQARILMLCARGGANVPTQYLFDRQRFETIAVNLPPAAQSSAAEMEAIVAALPPADIVFSAVGDGKADDPFLRQAAELARRLALPLLNPPEAIPPTCRDHLPELLAGIPALLAPATRRLGRDELATLARVGIERPLLVRPLGSHGGHDLCRVESGAEIAAYLERTPFDTFFTTDYVDYASADGYWRKYRFIFVDRQVFPYHLAIHTDWLIHYYRADMDRETWMKQEEEAFLTDHRTAFPGALAEAVAEAARRLDLDYGGMDCAVTRDGRVLVFEANACMLLHLHDSAEDFPYKHRLVPRIIDAISRMVVGRLGGALRQGGGAVGVDRQDLGKP